MIPKYQEIAATIRKQIMSGDYVLKRPPSGRTLAAESGVSYLTARCAVRQLVEENVFVRKKNGRLEINSRFLDISKKLKVALLRPNWYAPGFGKWYAAINQVVEDEGGILKTISFSHQNDPVVQDVLNRGFDLVFLEMVQLPPAVERKLVLCKGKVISLFRNRTALGINSVDGPGPESLELLLEHLYGLGHRKVASLTTEPGETTADDKSLYWEKGAKKLGMEVTTIIERVNPFEPADLKAYEVIRQKIKDGKINFTGLFCVSVNTAIAAMRAFHEEGYRIGKDMSVCSFGDPILSRLTIPSITVVNMPDPAKAIRAAIGYTRKGKGKARMFRVMKHELQIGESTGKIQDTL